MHSLITTFKKLSIGSAAFMLSTFAVVVAGGTTFADACTPPASTDSGVNRPVGADAGTYTYQCSGPYTGEWTNSYYVYNPVTGLRTATYDPDYQYDCNAGTWSMALWTYSPARSSFVSSRVPASAPAGQATGCPLPVSSGASGDPATSTSTPSGAGAGGDPGIVNTGPNSNNQANNSVAVNNTTTNNNNVGTTNNITAGSATGNSLVTNNTTAGDATSGDAQTVANIANMLQSTANVFGPDTATFVANINGDVNGDFMFDPAAILASGPNSNNQANNTLQVNTTVANNTSAVINNNIDVGANSGNATVASNTTGGNATSGDAQAIVNLMNLINSSVAAGQSFVGTININGDLNGDILLPQGVLDQLLASTGPNSNNATNTRLVSNTTVNNNVTEAIANNIHSDAQSGTATVAGNTTGGNATSGNGLTNVTLLNLTGSNTVGKDDLLVFVNVLGKWVGMIMNAPTGSTAAELGGGVISNTGPDSNNTTNTSVTNNNDLTNNADLAINNDVNVHAKTGDATVTHNTTAGNAQTGDARTAVNILNLTGSNLSLSDWFGVLFINVFGMWNGSFGVNTSAGDPVSNPSNNPVQAANQEQMLNSFKQFANFSSHSGRGNTPNSNATFTTASAAMPSTSGTVLGSSTAVAKKIAATNTKAPTPDNAPDASFALPIMGASLAALILLAGERDRVAKLFRRSK